MRNIEELQSNLGNIDLYLLDQLLKERYQKASSILEAGCGYGRNIDLIHRLGYDVSALDRNKECVLFCQDKFPQIRHQIILGDLENMPYPDEQFDHIISSAVFHFAESTDHFERLFGEHMRILRSGGTIFIRMTTAFGLDPRNKKPIADGV